MKQLTNSLEQIEKLIMESAGPYTSLRFITVFTAAHYWSY